MRTEWMDLFASLMEIILPGGDLRDAIGPWSNRKLHPHSFPRAGPRPSPSLTNIHLPVLHKACFEFHCTYSIHTCTSGVVDMVTYESAETCLNPRSSKRRKLQIACTQCRDRKTRCDGARPVCSTCDRRGKASACAYEQDELPTLQYGALLRLSLATVSDTVPQACTGRREPAEATRSSNTNTNTRSKFTDWRRYG